MYAVHAQCTCQLHSLERVALEGGHSWGCSEEVEALLLLLLVRMEVGVVVVARMGIAVGGGGGAGARRLNRQAAAECTLADQR
jgi:hypothetical protein